MHHCVYSQGQRISAKLKDTQRADEAITEEQIVANTLQHSTCDTKTSNVMVWRGNVKQVFFY